MLCKFSCKSNGRLDAGVTPMVEKDRLKMRPYRKQQASRRLGRCVAYVQNTTVSGIVKGGRIEASEKRIKNPRKGTFALVHFSRTAPESRYFAISFLLKRGFFFEMKRIGRSTLVSECGWIGQ